MTGPYDRPLPVLGFEPYADPFWDGTRDGELRVQECRACDARQFFPRPWCRNCASEDLQWTEIPGTGVLFNYTIVRTPVKSPEFEPDIPYVVGNIDLDGGVRMFSMVVECDMDAVENGMDLEVVFEEATEDVTLPLFRPR